MDQSEIEHMFLLGYLVHMGHLTIKSDVYSFGVVLLEILSRRYVDKGRICEEHYLVEWVSPILRDPKRFYRLFGPHLQGHFSLKAAHDADVLASLCISSGPKKRPLMSKVIGALKPMLGYHDMAVSSPTYGPIFAGSSSHVVPRQHGSRRSSSAMVQRGRG